MANNPCDRQRPGTGGSGGRDGAVVSVGARWIYAALHELGHSAFALADEYEYLAGCDKGEIAQNIYTDSFEPPELNISTVGNFPKWVSLVTPGTSLPTTSNPNCTTCDAQEYWIAPETVGAFEDA